MNYELLLQLIVNGLIVGTLYGVVAMCFVLIYKSTRVVNFAQGEFLLIGAWTCWAMLQRCAHQRNCHICLVFLSKVLLQKVRFWNVLSMQIRRYLRIHFLVGMRQIGDRLARWAFGQGRLRHSVK